MNEEILINSTPNETRVAFVENGVLQEVMMERNHNESIVGNIFCGRVEKILPGLQAAFIDIGQERSAFMHVSDIGSRTKPIESIENDISKQNNKPLPISRQIHEGQSIVVQVFKDAIGKKGARVTTQISIPSRFLVLLPYEQNLRSLSIRITDEQERERLQGLIDEIGSEIPEYGIIARTNAEASTIDELQHDIQFLQRLWKRVLKRISANDKRKVLYTELDLPERTVRDFINDEVQEIKTDSYKTHQNLEKFITAFAPNWPGKLIYYKDARPIFDFHNIDHEISRALKKFVPLKSGGNLVIDQNEALTTIDVNTGKFLGAQNQDDTILKTNLEAAHSIARQMRLRNIGGIIIADFIDMNVQSHKELILETLERLVNNDPTRTYIHGITQLGLVEITRKRTTENLQQMLTENCSNCSGLARVKTVETICYELYREIIRAVRQFQTGQVMVIASVELIDFIYDEQTKALATIEEDLGKSISLQPESTYSQEQYDVVLV